MVASQLTFPLGTGATLDQGYSRILGQGSDLTTLPPKPSCCMLLLGSFKEGISPLSSVQAN